MLRRAVIVLLLVLFASPALAMDYRQGFDGIAWGSACKDHFSGPEWIPYDAYPLWNKKNRTLTLSFDDHKADDTGITLRYHQRQRTHFEGFSVLNVYYGCKKKTGQLALVVVRYSVPSGPSILKKLTEDLGPPTMKNITQTIWDQGDVYVQFDQSVVIFYWKKAGVPRG